MKFLFVYQFVLLLCATKSKSTWVDLPIQHPLIQPIWVNKTWDEDTNVSNYNMRFRGPSDTKEELDVISLVEVERGDRMSIFESHVQVPLGDYMFISLKSASTSDTFKMSIVGDAKSGSQDQFPGRLCEFEIIRETTEQKTLYLALPYEPCYSDPKENLDIFVYFEVNLRKGNQSYLYRGMEENNSSDLKKYVEYVDEIDGHSLFIYNKNLQTDGYRSDTPFICILVMKYMPSQQDIITVYGWTMQIENKTNVH